MEQGRIEDIVRNVLIEKPDCRNDDFLLIRDVFRKMVPESSSMSFSKVCRYHNRIGAISFESITRARRKIQADCPALKSSEPVNSFRVEREQGFRDHYGTGKEL